MSRVAEMIPILLWWQGEMIKQMDCPVHLIGSNWKEFTEDEFIELFERKIELLKSTPANYQKIETCVQLSTYIMMLAAKIRDENA